MQLQAEVTEHQQGYITNIGQVFLNSKVSRCIHQVSRELFASLRESLLLLSGLLKQVEQKGDRSKIEQEKKSRGLERGMKHSYVYCEEEEEKKWKRLLRTPVLEDLLCSDQARQRECDTDILSQQLALLQSLKKQLCCEST